MPESRVPSPTQARGLIQAILAGEAMSALWGVSDRGLPVPIHTMDVALLALDRSGTMDRLTIAASALIHDMGKLGGVNEDGRAHSAQMREHPEAPTRIAMAALEAAEQCAVVWLPAETREHIEHIVLSHHGKNGRVPPSTDEARLLAECDELSAIRHRLPPVDANDILPLLIEGYSWVGAARVLRVNREVIKKRLDDALAETGKRDWPDLVPLWHRDGSVPIGPTVLADRIRRVKDMRRVAQLPAYELAAMLLGERLPDGANVESIP